MILKFHCEVFTFQLVSLQMNDILHSKILLMINESHLNTFIKMTIFGPDWDL